VSSKSAREVEGCCAPFTAGARLNPFSVKTLRKFAIRMKLQLN